MRMVRASQSAFTTGEIGPGLAARIDVARFYSAAALMQNVLVRPQGGARRRPGMRHIATLGVTNVNLIPFSFNVEQTYVIVLADAQFSVYRSDGLFLATVTGCPWNLAQALQMNFAQSADTLLLVHPNVEPQRVLRGATETTWTRSAVPLTNIPTFDYGSGAEPVISATRGWPECCTFHQSRLWFGGLRSRPATFLASKIGDFFNFDAGTGLDDEAINATIDSDQVNAIHQMASGRNLLIFTSGAEHVVTGEPITPSTITVQEQSRRGIKRLTPTVEMDGAQLFIQRGGTQLRTMVYQDVEAAWRTDAASLLAPHLILDPVDMDARRGQTQDDADHVLLVNALNSIPQMTVLTTLRTQEVTALTRWVTNGLVYGLAALPTGQVFFAVGRGAGINLEIWDDSRLLDASVVQTSGTPFTVVTGLGHLDGRNVAMVADGNYLGTALVSGGQVTLPRSALTAEVGLAFTVQVQTLPIEPRDATGSMLGRRYRVASCTARVQQTGRFRINGVEAAPRRVTDPLDGAAPIYTGDLTVRGLLGFAQRQTITLEQTTPAPFEVLGLAYELQVGT